MAYDFNQLSLDQLQAIKDQQDGIQNRATGGGQPAPVSNTPSLTMVKPSTDNLVFTGSGGVENLPGVAAKQAVLDQASVNQAVAQKQALAPLVQAEDEQKQIFAKNLAKKDFDQELNSFFAVDHAIPRGEGFHRFEEGLRSLGSSVGQENMRGIATAAHKAASLKLRTSIARLKDSGNLSENEQNAAGQMIPGIFDSEKLVELKRAYLKQLGTAINTGDHNLVVEVLNGFKKSEGFDQEKHNAGNAVDLDELLGPVDLNKVKL